MEIVKWVAQRLGLPRNHYIRYAWYEVFFARILISVYVAQHLVYCTPEMPQNFPNGLTRFLGIDFRPVCSLSTWFFPWLSFLVGVVWACQRFETAASGTITFLLIAYGTARNSSGGVHHGTQIVTMTMLTQFLAHLVFRWKKRVVHDSKSVKSSSNENEDDLDEGSYCMYIAQQTVAAGYLVCAVMKTVNTHGNWLLETPNLLVSLITLNEREGYSQGRTPSLMTDVITPLMFEHPFTAILFFSPGYIFEMGFPLLLWGNRRAHLLGGIAVYLMHVFIFIVMRLSFGSFQLLLVALFINFPYWTRQIFDWVRRRVGLSSSKTSYRSSDYCVVSEVKPPSNTWWGIIRSVWGRIPCKTMLVLVVICFVARDRAYPFSHFPMYSTPTPEGNYFYLTATYGTNATLQPLKTTFFFMKTSAQIKKYHWKSCMAFWRPQGVKVEHWINDTEKFSKCANMTLSYMLTMAKPSRKKFLGLYDNIQLHWVTLKYHNWQFVRADDIVASLSMEGFRQSQFTKGQRKKLVAEAKELLDFLHQQENNWDEAVSHRS